MQTIVKRHRRMAAAGAARIPMPASPRSASRRRDRRPTRNRSSQERARSLDERDGDRENRERDHAGEERGAAPSTVAHHAAEQAADHHPEWAGGQRVDERGTRQSPFLDQRRDGVGQELVVDAVENDGERGAEYEQLLVPGPAPFIEHVRRHQPSSFRSSLSRWGRLRRPGLERPEVYQPPHMMLWRDRRGGAPPRDLHQRPLARVRHRRRRLPAGPVRRRAGPGRVAAHLPRARAGAGVQRAGLVHARRCAVQPDGAVLSARHALGGDHGQTRRHPAAARPPHARGLHARGDLAQTAATTGCR